MTIQIIQETLTKALQKPLPGLDAQLKMASFSRLQRLKVKVPENPRLAAVLLLLYPNELGETHFVLMERTKGGVHSKQISFPGGQVEEADTDREATALRETYEEVGVPSEDIQVIGRLSELFIPPSQFLVTPVVGYMNQRPQFVLESSEVASIIEVPLSLLREKSTVKQKVLNVQGMEFEAPYYDIHGHVVWGATAMMLSEFIAIIEA